MSDPTPTALRRLLAKLRIARRLLPDRDVTPYWNQYRNSVLLQERTLAQMYRELEELPSWAHTMTMFLSDHGEQFREHGRLYHINDMFEEEVRVPAFVAAGPAGLDDDERAALHANRDRRVYSRDVNATMLDALGVLEQRSKLPFSDKLTGRSVLRPFGPEEPTVPGTSGRTGPRTSSSTPR